MFEQERLSYDPSCATRAEGFGEGNEQMDRQDQHIAHERQINTSADQHKTEPSRDSCQKNYEFATHRRLRIRKYGARTIITRADLTSFLENLPDKTERPEG